MLRKLRDEERHFTGRLFRDAGRDRESRGAHHGFQGPHRQRWAAASEAASATNDAEARAAETATNAAIEILRAFYANTSMCALPPLGLCVARVCKN